MGPDDKVTRDGETLTSRVWALIASAAASAHVPAPEVAQGGFKGGNGAGASAGTHDGGDVYDLRVNGLSTNDALRLVDELRRRNACAWLRSPAYGWTSTGPHIHAVQRDSAYPLSPGARAQVVAYDEGLNGLANKAPDPFDRPPQRPWPYRSVVSVTGRTPVGASTCARIWGVSVARVLWFNPRLIRGKAKPGTSLTVPPGGRVLPVHAGPSK